MPILVSKNIQKLSAILLMLVSIQKEKAFKLDLQPDEIKKFERSLKQSDMSYPNGNSEEKNRTFNSAI